MNIDDIRTLFTNSIAEIILDKTNFFHATKTEFNIINKSEQYSNERNASNITVAMHNMSFICFETKRPIFYHFRELTHEDMKQNIRHRKNRQYQWLIAEAYEKFEEFIENIYAYLGSPELDFWSLSDYGNITFHELKQCDYEWYLKQAKARKGGASGIFKNIYKKFQITVCYNEIPLNILIGFIEKMRHIIVHKRGTVASKENFFKDVFSSVGISLNDNRSDKIRNFFDLFFLDKEHPNTLLMLEIRNDKLKIESYISIFDIITGILLNTAYIICSECARYARSKI